MVRTQLLFEQWQYQALKAAAENEGVSMSEMVRTIVARHFSAPEPAKPDGLAGLSGLTRDRGFSARDHDGAIYSPKNQKRKKT